MTISTLPAESATLLDLRADMSMSARQRFAIADIVKGSALWRLSWTLGWLDIKLRYRGSVLGPFWLTLSTGIMVGALGLLYSSLFHMNLHEYLPFLSLSLVLWGFLSTLISEACTTFTEAEVDHPLGTHAVLRVCHHGSSFATCWRWRTTSWSSSSCLPCFRYRRAWRPSWHSPAWCCGSWMRWHWRCCSAVSAHGSATSNRS